MQEYDFSREASRWQRFFFAIWGGCQLIVSNIAFQRDGFFYGLLVLVFGIVAFCAAISFAHRLNRQRVSVGPVGIALEQGLTRARIFAWNAISQIEKRHGRLTLVLKDGGTIELFFIEWDEKKDTVHLRSSLCGLFPVYRLLIREV